MSRVLAIDYGASRIGLAISDELKLCAIPYKTIRNNSDKKTLYNISAIVEENNVDTVVVGYPSFFDGTESEQTKQVVGFIKSLKSFITVEIVSFDERYSSKEAQSVINSRQKRKYQSARKNKEEIDRVAASIILQNYLDCRAR